jgi:argonaute-like protein implicated in RNA metabolism and viral defense
VALNKVLLTNQKWPFFIKTPLHADLTIGIDVKLHTVGLVVVAGGGRHIRSLIRTSRQKERLLEDQMKGYALEIIRAEATSYSQAIKTIVIHRDGRTYQSELKGLEAALEELKREGVIHPEAILTVLEVAKTSPVFFRLFDVTNKNGREWVENPQVGCYFIINDIDAFLCSTGRTFQHRGTTRPLHLRRVHGSLGLLECLEDVYYLTTLAWSKPDDCSRYPITFKLCDRYLVEDATEYDPDKFETAKLLDQEEDEDSDE